MSSYQIFSYVKSKNVNPWIGDDDIVKVDEDIDDLDERTEDNRQQVDGIK